MGKSREELGNILRRMYDEAPYGEQAAWIHLFGIKYGDEIRSAGLNAREVVDASGIKTSYHTEVAKGMKLAKYVVPRAQYAD